jgi:hypothetical protein
VSDLVETVLVPLVQAAAGVVATTVATRVCRRLWRQHRLRVAVDGIVRAVEDEMRWLIEQGEAEYSNRHRAKQRLAIARLKREYPSLSESEACVLVEAAVVRLHSHQRNG